MTPPAPSDPALNDLLVALENFGAAQGNLILGSLLRSMHGAEEGATSDQRTLDAARERLRGVLGSLMTAQSATAPLSARSPEYLIHWELEHICAQRALPSDQVISPEAAAECARRGWVALDSLGNFQPTRMGLLVNNDWPAIQRWVNHRYSTLGPAAEGRNP